MIEPSIDLAFCVQKIAPFHVMEVPTAARALEAAERSLVPMAIGEPDFPSSPQVLAAPQRALTHGHIHYTCALGMASLHSQAFCRDARQGACGAITPGIDFGGHRADKHVRFAYTIGREKREEGVARLRRFPAPATWFNPDWRPYVSLAIVCRAAAALLTGTLLLSGCSAIDFYWQGVSGQMNLIAGARPITDILETTNDPLLKTRLTQVQAIRAFASRELGLPDNRSYTRYTDLGRPFVVWNVVATPELSLTPRQWCYAIVGCVSYRGYFNEDDARHESERLVARGDDVHLGGVPAYSTLGWFDDPVLSTFVRYRETELARLIFHELAHQVIYVKDDTAFNESFAVSVEEEGMRRWLAAQAGRKDAEQLAEDVARTRRLRADFRSMVRATRDRLRALYASTVPEAEKRAGKTAAFADMRAQYERLKAGWGGLAAYDRWIATGANNAGIAGVGLYADHVPEFAALIAANHHDLPRFFEDVKMFASMPKAQREARLAALVRPPAIAGNTLPSPPLLSTSSSPGALAP